MERKLVRLYLRGQAGGSEAFAPDPADPEIDTRASQAHREEKKARTSEHSFDPQYTLHGT